METTQHRPIVCGTDFSEPAKHAANVATALAHRVGAPVVLVHGVDERGEIPNHYWPTVIEAARPHLTAEANRLRQLGAHVEETFADGVPDDGVAKCAERADARLIVLAASGHGVLGRWMLGSVTERIAESAWVPTIVLRGSDRLEDWTRGGRPLRVFVGADFTACSDAAMRWAAGLTEFGPCEFVVGYVDHLAEQRAEEVRNSPVDAPSAPELQEMLNYDLGEKARGFLPNREFTVRVLPASGRIDTHLLELAKDADAELIVVGTHQWRGLSRLRHASVSRRVLHTSPVSVACVPAHQVLTSANALVPEVRYVVAATDLSTHGSRAVPHAYGMLQPGGTVCLVHVAPPGSAKEPLLGQLRALIPEDATRRGFQTEVQVIFHHDAAAGLCDAVERLNADVLCLGSHSRSPLAATALGSVSHSVIARSKRPVLIVPGDLP